MALKRKFDVVVLGGLNTDFVILGNELPRPGQTVQGDTFYSGSGGKGANQAVAAARLGARVAMIGRVGNDARGTELIEVLKRERVDTTHLTRDATTPTGAAIISVDSTGEKQINAAPGANSNLSLKQVRQASKLIASGRVLLMQLESPIRCILEAARIAAKHETQIVLDPAPPTELPPELFPLLHVIRPNSDEAQKITRRNVRDRNSARKAGRLLLKRGVRIVAMESGDGGDLLLTAKEELFFPRLKVQVIDATGAGDAFAAGLSVALAEGLPLQELGRMANATAALATTKIGAQEALPTRREVERLLRRNH